MRYWFYLMLGLAALFALTNFVVFFMALAAGAEGAAVLSLIGMTCAVVSGISATYYLSHTS